MKIHLKQIPSEGLHLEGEEDCPISELAVDGVRCSSPLRYQLDVGISSAAFWARGTLVQPVEMHCVSCLEPFAHTIQIHDFAVHVELTGPEAIDLTPFMREDILLNLPPHPHCDRNGGRVCKMPNLPPASTAVPRQSDWSALDKLKIKKR